MKNDQSNERPTLKLCTVKIAVVFDKTNNVLQVIPYKVESITDENNVSSDEDKNLIQDYKKNTETKKYHEIEHESFFNPTGYNTIFQDTNGWDNSNISRFQKTTTQIVQTELEKFFKNKYSITKRWISSTTLSTVNIPDVTIFTVKLMIDGVKDYNANAENPHNYYADTVHFLQIKQDDDQPYEQSKSNFLNTIVTNFTEKNNNKAFNTINNIPKLFTYNLKTAKVKINIDQIASFVKMMRTKSDNGKSIIEELSSVKSPSSDYTPVDTPDTQYNGDDDDNDNDNEPDNYGGKSYRKKMRHPHKKSVKKHHKKTHRKLKNKRNKSHKKH
jgi:hypothetical protein